MILKIKVKPNSREQKIEKISDNEFKIYLKEKPENNKANLALLRLLKKEFRRNVKIIKGKTSRNKIIEIKDER